MNNKKRQYNYEVVLQNATDEYPEQYNNILLNFDTIYCVHDRDIYDDDVIVDDLLLHSAGDRKYSHTHFIIKMKTAKTISAVAKIIGCKETDIEFIKNFNSALKYLIHYKDDKKFNYDPQSVQSNDEKLKIRFKSLIYDDMTEEENILPLIDYISSFNGALEFNTFLRFVILSNRWSIYRRNASTFIKLIEEHNFIHNKTGFLV